MLNSYTSNDWIEPIVSEARPIFEEFPGAVATELASAVLKHVDVGRTEIPWVTVFPSDDKTQIMPRLAKVLQTPDYSTPAYDPETHLAHEELLRLLERHEAYGLLAPQAAYCLVQAAAGKEDELFSTYQDKSRNYPQYASVWRSNLMRQFGQEGYREIMSGDYKLLELLLKTERVAEHHNENGSSIAQPGESTTDVITRTFEFFDIQTDGVDFDAIVNATKILERGLEGYRALAYQVRGLPIPNEID